MQRQIHIIGPMNTGTNLLFNIINNSNCIDLINNTTIKSSNQHNPFNKHILEINIIEDYLRNKDNLLIIMYKNVYNWLYSIKKANYSIKYTKLFLPVELDNKKFSNMIELYNFYYINYMSILERYPNVIFLDYNKVINIQTSYDYINQTLSKINLSILSKDNFNKTLMTSSKNHGNSVKNSQEAVRIYDINQQMVYNFLQKKKKFNRSVKHTLIDYYENKT